MADSRYLWRLPDQALDLEHRLLVMGIVNVTPDSFSDGGLFATTDAAVAHGLTLAQQGADILDIGGESSRPGATPVPLDEELRRVLPVVERLAAQTSVLLSVDTCKAEVARACLAAGARIVNDITALTGDAAMPEVVRNSGAGVILMHMQGTPPTMQVSPVYEDVVKDIVRFFEERLQQLTNLGIAREQFTVDPGIGFGKTFEHNLKLLGRLEELHSLERPVCLGVSRKGFIGKILNRPLEQRLLGSVAMACYAVSRRAAQIVRVHDVAETREAMTLIAAIQQYSS
jgi:dihydropteroate synthase